MLLERFQRPVRGVRVVDRGMLGGSKDRCVQIIPLRPLSRKEVDRLLDQLTPKGDLLITSALSQRERSAFEQVGFVERESLHLLRHDLKTVPEPSDSTEVSLRSGRRSDIDAVLEIDRESFDTFWVLDRDGFQAVRKATPVHHFTVAVINSTVVGYAVSGRSLRAAFLQRLGVHPDVRRSGIGAQLVRDAVVWARNEGANSMLVNTQDRNEKAVRLYQRFGFELTAEKLKVLERPTTKTSTH